MKAQSLQNYGTPPGFFAALDRDFARLVGYRLTLDVCAEKWSAKCPLYFTKKDNALAQEWRHGWFCNPPYNDQRTWLEKANAEANKGRRGVMLLKAATAERYWMPLTFERGTTDLVYGRMAFIHPKTKRPQSGADFASAVVWLGPGIPSGVVRYRCARSGELLASGARVASRIAG
jgi:phage N-6-adenine-methyltransferase